MLSSHHICVQELKYSCVCMCLFLALRSKSSKCWNKGRDRYVKQEGRMGVFFLTFTDLQLTACYSFIRCFGSHSIRHPHSGDPANTQNHQIQTHALHRVSLETECPSVVALWPVVGKKMHKILKVMKAEYSCTVVHHNIRPVVHSFILHVKSFLWKTTHPHI